MCSNCPTYTATPSGTTNICNGSSTDITFTFSDGTAPYDLTWTGGTLTGISNGHTESVSPTTTTTYTISSATDANGCTATPSGSAIITVIDVVNLGAITGSNNVCTNQSTNYSVAAVAGVNSYDWTAPPGATITSGQGTPTITINWNGATSGDVCVEAVNPCGTGMQSCRTVTVTPLPNPPDPITGEETVCTGIALPYSISDVPDATNYNWTVPTGATILSGQGTAAVSIRWNTASTGNVCVRAQNTCGNSAYTCLSVASVAVPTNPVFLAGNFAPCESATLDYGVTPQAAFDDYQWTYDNGGNITAGQGTPNITVDWLGAGDGQLCVTASSTLCSVDRTACKSLVIKLLPPMPEYDSADDALCVGDTGVYVLSPISGATSYNWVASGGQFIGNQTGSTVKIKWPAPAFTTMEVSANNSCGTGPINYGPTVLVSEPPAMPGTLSGPTTACQGSTQTYSIAAVPGAETYIWTVPSGATIQSGQGTVSISVKFNALGTGNVCVKAKTGVCESAARCTSVTVGASVGAPGPVSGPASVCTSSQATYSVASVPGATSYVWTLPPGATFVGGNNTASVTVNFAGSSSGQVCVAAVSSCGNSATSCLAVAVGASLAPTISGATSFCTGGSTVLDAGAGYATYAWAGPNGFAANSQQATVNEPGIYTVTVSAAGGCTGTASVAVTVGASLNPTIAGSTAFCTGGSATLDAGSGYATYIWAGPNGFTANIQQPTVNTPGTYTVTVSNASGCSGTDAHPLTANPLPTPTITGPTTVCSGNAVTLDAGAGYTAHLWSSTATTQTISATTAGIYAVTVTDGNGCTGTDTHTLTISGLTPPPCQSALTLPIPNSTNVPVSTALQWSATPGCVDGYRLSIGTTPGGSEILNAANVGNVTTYQPAAALPAGKQVYVRVVPYNGVGEASGCGEFSFGTAGGSSAVCSSDSLALVAFYTATNGPAWFNKWDLSKPVKTWYGIQLTPEGCVRRIDLTNNNLKNSIPNLNLPSLQVLDLDNNQLSGTLPDFNLPSLQVLDLDNNQLAGKIPNFNLPNLVFCDLSKNSLAGTIPNFNLPKLTQLYLFQNLLTGPLPAFNLPELGIFHFYLNPINDTLSDFKLPKAWQLWAYGCQLKGQIPNFSQMPGLKELWLHNNTLDGPIPLLDKTPKLNYLNLFNNRLSGSIPAFNLPDLYILSLAQNKLTGMAPGFNLPSVILCHLNDNRLTQLPALTALPIRADTVNWDRGLRTFKNRLTFEDVLPSIGKPSYNYQPQDTIFHDTLLIRNVGENLDFSLDFDEAIATNVYKWYKDGIYQPAQDQTGNNNLMINNLQPNHAGKWTVEVTNPGAPDLTLYSKTITLQVCSAAPAALSAPQGDTLTCTRTSLPLASTGGASYAWSGGSAVNAQQSTVNTPGIYTVTVTYSDGCTASASRTVTEDKTSPNITALADTLTCASPVAVLQGNSTTPGVTYAWSGPNGFTSGLQNPPVNVAGTYILTVQDPANACSARDTVVVEAAIGVPSATIATPNGTLLNCTVDSVRLVAPAGAGYTYVWSGGSVANSPTLTAKTPGTYTVTVTDGTNGCSATASVIVEKNTASPSAAAAGGVLPCQNPFVILQGNSGTSGVTYSWSGPSGFAANQQNPPVSVAGTYTLTVRNTVNGCTSTATAAVLPPQLPTASITAPSGQQLTCTLTNLPLQASGGNQYAWAGPGGFTANGQQPTVNTPGTYTVTVTNTANGCTNTATTTIGLNQAAPLVSATTATLTCAQPTAVISSSSNASGATYTWVGPGGTQISNVQQAMANVQGVYVVTATNPANGCTGTATTTVSENKTPPAAAIAAPGGTSLTCLVSSVSLQASGGGGYVWAGPNGFSANGQQQIANSPGAYTVTVTSPTNGCTAPATVVVSENKNAPSLSAVGGQLSCAQFQAVLQASSSAAGATFKWAGPGGFLASGPQPTVSSAGTYTCTVTDPVNGCTATQQVTVAPVPVLSPSIAPVKAICPGASVGLKASGGFNSYRWSNGQLTDSITVNQPGVYIVTVTDADQCVGTASVSVTAAPAPQPMIGGTLAFCPGGSTTLSVTPSGQYLWNGPSGFVFTGQKPAVNVPGTYTVTVTNSEGCTGTQSVTVSGYSAALALLLVSEDTVCAGEAVTFTAGGGKEYRFWLDGVAQGGFSSNKTFVLNNPANGATVTVQIMDTNNCPDSTAAGDGPGREPISISVLPQPNLSAAFVTQIPTCPEDSVRLLMNLPNLPNGTYTVHWQVDNLPPSAASVLLINKLGSTSLPPLPPGPHTCKVLSAEVMGSGCASTWPTSSSTLSFTVPQPAVTPLDTTICYTQSVQVGGKTYTQSGTYTEVLQTAAGCDSTVVLKLKSVTEFQVQRVVAICPGNAYPFYGQTLTEAGFYEKKVSGALGCDSLVQLVLTIESPVYDFLSKTVCPGVAYTIGDSTFTEPGTYEIPLKSKVTGCDSTVIFTLKWPTNPLAVSFLSDTLRICNGTTLSLAPTVQHCTNCKYKWTGGATLPSIFVSPTLKTTYTVTVTDAVTSCTATAAVTLLVDQAVQVSRDTTLCSGEALIWCGKVITLPGDYPCTFQTATGCDSTVTLKVTVFEDKFDAANDSLSVALGVSEQVYDVAEKILQNDLYSGVYDIQIVKQPLIDSVVLEDAGQTLRYLLRAGPRFGVDSFQYALCPPNGCPEACDSAWVRVRLQNGDLEEVQARMPNLLTPNDDGQNDIFDPLGFLRNWGSIFPDEKSVRLYIYNRWGEVVHRPHPYQPWDGLKGNEKPLPQATYYYRLTFEIGEEVHELKGAVNLLK